MGPLTADFPPKDAACSLGRNRPGRAPGVEKRRFSTLQLYFCRSDLPEPPQVERGGGHQELPRDWAANRGRRNRLPLPGDHHRRQESTNTIRVEGHPRTPITKSLTRITDLNYTFLHYEYYVQTLSLSGSRRSSVIHRVQPSQATVDRSRPKELQLHRQRCVRRGPGMRRRLPRGSCLRDLPGCHTKLASFLKPRALT
jgi:hypothetical protein